MGLLGAPSVLVSVMTAPADHRIVDRRRRHPAIGSERSADPGSARHRQAWAAVCVGIRPVREVYPAASRVDFQNGCSGVRIVPVEDSETRRPAGRSVREVVLCGVVSSPGMRTVRSVAQVVGAAGYR